MLADIQAHAETLQRIREDRDVQRQRLGDRECTTMDVTTTTTAAAAAAAVDADVDADVIADANDSAAVNTPSPSVTETTLQVVQFYPVCKICS